MFLHEHDRGGGLGVGAGRVLNSIMTHDGVSFHSEPMKPAEIAGAYNMLLIRGNAFHAFHVTLQNCAAQQKCF